MADNDYFTNLDFFMFTNVASLPKTIRIIVRVKGNANGFDINDYIEFINTFQTNFEIWLSDSRGNQLGETHTVTSASFQNQPSYVKSQLNSGEWGVIYDSYYDSTVPTSSPPFYLGTNLANITAKYNVKLGSTIKTNSLATSSHNIMVDNWLATSTVSSADSTISGKIYNQSKGYYLNKRWRFSVVDDYEGTEYEIAKYSGTSNDPTTVDTLFKIPEEAWAALAKRNPNSERVSLGPGSANYDTIKLQMAVSMFQGESEYEIYNNSSTSSLNSVLLPASFRPIVNTVTPSDTKGYRTKFGVYVQGKSILACQTDASGIYNSTISKIDYVIDNKTVSTTDLTIVNTIGLLEQSGSRTLTTTVTDSRGRTAVQNTDITVAPYVSPTFSFSAMRWDTEDLKESDGSTTVRLVCSGDIPSINSVPVTGTITVQGRQKDAAEWLTIGTATVSSTFEEIFTTLNQSLDYSYEYRATLVDEFETSMLLSDSIGTATPVLEFNATGKGVGIGIVAPETGLDIGMDVNVKEHDLTVGGDLEVKAPPASEKSQVILTDPTGVNSNVLASLDDDRLTLLANLFGTDRAFLASHIFLNNNIDLGALTTGKVQTSILRMNASNQVELNWTSGGLKGRVKKTIYSGYISRGASVTISELPYYNIILVRPYSPVVYGNNSYLIGVKGWAANELHTYGFAFSGQTIVYSINLTYTGTKLTFSDGNRIAFSRGTYTFEKVNTIGPILGLI